MRRTLALVASAAILATGGCASARMGALPWPETGMPACAEDAPRSVPALCVWADDDDALGEVLWLVSPDGTSNAFPACPTEDSPLCVWDNGDIDSAERFWLNGPERR